MNQLIERANRIDANRGTHNNQVWYDGDIRTVGAVGRSTNIITMDRLRDAVPSAFAHAAHQRVSSRYSFLPTASVLEGLAQKGWVPVMAQEQKVRNPESGRDGFQKHMIRFAHLDLLDHPDRPELLLINSSDRSSAYNLHAGIFRAACMNGLIVCDATFAKVSITHMDFEPGKVIEASVEMLNDIPRLMGAVANLKGVSLSDGEKLAFARAAHVLRFPDYEGDRDAQHAIPPQKLLAARREADNANDLYTVMNVVQENAVKGGQLGIQRVEGKRSRRVRTREVKGIDGNVNLNKALWTLAEEMAKAKASQN